MPGAIYIRGSLLFVAFAAVITLSRPVEAQASFDPARFFDEGSEPQERSEHSADGQGGRLHLADAQNDRPTDPGASPNTADPQSTQGDRHTGKKTNVEEVVVTAQRREERLQDVPISVSVLSGAELDRNPVQGVSEALNTIPGVATQQNYLGGGTIIAVRGVAPSFPTLSGSNPIGYYLDGVPFGLVHSAVAPDTNAYDLDRVEVLRGPQGTLYGASALNGVVRILTEDPDLRNFDVKARLGDSYTEYGSNNYRGDLTINVPLIDERVAARATVGYQNYDGWIDQPNKKNVNNLDQRTYRLKLSALPTDDLSMLLSAWSSRSASDAPNVGITFDKNLSTLDQPTLTKFDTYAAKVGYHLPAFDISSTTSYLDYVNVGNLGLDIPPFNIPDLIFYNRINGYVFAEELGLHSSSDGPWRWSFGGIYRRAIDTTNQSYNTVGLPPPLPDFFNLISRSYAVYGELTRLLMDGRLELTGGIRHFHDEIEQDSLLQPGLPVTRQDATSAANTPRGVVTWHITQKQMLYASYSQGFRSGLPQEAAAAILGFGPVSPDRLRNYEIGSKGDLLDNTLSYDVSVYYMKWQGIQQQLSVPAPAILNYAYPFVIAIVNGQSASGPGVDVALSTRPLKGLTLSVTGSWNQLEMDKDVFSGGLVLFSKGDRPTSSPETTAGFSADYYFPMGNAGYTGRFNASLNYTSSLTYRGLNGLGNAIVIQEGDPITIGQVRFGVGFPNNLIATLYIDNVNNERGSPVKAFIGVPNWDAQIRPRTYGLQVDYKLR